MIPFANVEVAAEVTFKLPPVTVKPFEDESPAVSTPPENVEVPVLVTRKPPVTASEVVVAFVVVALSAVKFCKVVEPVTSSADERIDVPLSPTILLVALPPTTTDEIADKRVVEAFNTVKISFVESNRNVESELILVVVSQKETRPATPVPVMVPAPVPTQTLLTAKHPLERLKPLFAVLVAPEDNRIPPPVTVKPFVDERPPAPVE